MSLASLETHLGAIAEQLHKAAAEINAKIDALQADLEAAGELPAGARARLDELKAIAQALDDIVPDAPPAAPEDPETPAPPEEPETPAPPEEPEEPEDPEDPVV